MIILTRLRSSDCIKKGIEIRSLFLWWSVDSSQWRMIKVQRAKFKECIFIFLNVSPKAIPTLFFILCALNLYSLLYNLYSTAEHCKRAKLFYNAPLIIESTTPGSNNVDVSPKLPNSPSATLRRMRRMILPERVLGKPETN